ncbi:MAG: sensor histidine kinase [Dokdonella sp.]
MRSLVFKLAIFYMLLSLPSLLLVESTTLVYEYREVMTRVDDGALVDAANVAAQSLASTWRDRGYNDKAMLSAWTEALALNLQQPSGTLANESYVLLELNRAPIVVVVLDPRGNVIASYPVGIDAATRLLDVSELAFDSNATSARNLSHDETSGSDGTRRVLAPIRSAGGELTGLLYLELRLPLPWKALFNDVRFEWPIVFGYVLVFGLGASFFLATWVTRRLKRVEHAAMTWRSGDFSEIIGDRSADELGRLSRLLDGMAVDLKALIQSRSLLATLGERQRLARELHDTVKQKAFAMSLQLATLRRQLGDHAAGDRVVQAERLSQQIQQDLAQILDELRSPDAGLPFVDRLRQRAQDWAQLSHIALHLDLTAPPEIPAQSEEALLRIVDEALSNVLRHSGATGTTISMHGDERELVLQITDNGRGMGADATPGMGLANMRERAQSLPGGEFALASVDTGGVRIRVTLRAA